LVDADLSGAALGDTIIANTDLGAAHGLDSVNHLGPSTIGIDTLFKSGGGIPETFLRGCGAPDDLINFARSLVGRSMGPGQPGI
ncbi:MAG TPA: toll/interleukin-1 receptor domain-containing protein, partial [Blastocatellia bacterium]|nr:toll/interleukin-1 receptor domain-containing protein [Blastocatellia bacterium]